MYPLSSHSSLNRNASAVPFKLKEMFLFSSGELLEPIKESIFVTVI